MLTFTRIATIRTTSLVLPKAAVASGISSRFFAGIGDDLAHKVRVCYCTSTRTLAVQDVEYKPICWRL